MRTGYRVFAVVTAVLFLLEGNASTAEESTPYWKEGDREVIAQLQAKVKTRKGAFRLKTKRWMIESEVNPAFTAQLGLFMERFSEVFTTVLSGRTAVPIKPTVVVFATEERYREKLNRGRTDRDESDTWSRGLFRWRFSGTTWVEFHLYTYVDAEQPSFDDFPHSILLHEGTHALLQQYLGPTGIATWFTEGLAEHFETWDLRLDETENGKRCRESTATRLRRVTQSESPVPVERILALTRDNWSPDGGGILTRQNYALSAAFVDFLLATDRNRQVLVTVFQRMANGQNPEHVLSPQEIRVLTPGWEAHWRRMLVGS